MSTTYSLIGRAPSAIAVCGLRPGVMSPRATVRARAVSGEAETTADDSLVAGTAVEARDADVAANGRERTRTATPVLTSSRSPRTPTRPET